MYILFKDKEIPDSIVFQQEYSERRESSSQATATYSSIVTITIPETQKKFTIKVNIAANVSTSYGTGEQTKTITINQRECTIEIMNLPEHSKDEEIVLLAPLFNDETTTILDIASKNEFIEYLENPLAKQQQLQEIKNRITEEYNEKREQRAYGFWSNVNPERAQQLQLLQNSENIEKLQANIETVIEQINNEEATRWINPRIRHSKLKETLEEIKLESPSSQNIKSASV